MTDAVRAEYGIPHCKYERTPEGFKVEFSKNPEVTPGKTLLAGMIVPFALIGGLIFIGIYVATEYGAAAGCIAWLISFIVGLILSYKIFGAKLVTRIEVTADSIIINEKRLSRADFSHFNVSHSISGRGPTRVVLGYRYGNVSTAFGGLWKEREGDDFTNALNYHVRQVPTAEDKSRASPEKLRAARPTDF